MKRTLITIAAAIGMSTALFAESAPAIYEIPFSFNAAGVELPAGRYVVSQNGVHSSTLAGHGGGMIFIRNSGLTGGKEKAHMIFSKRGNAYLLREVWQDNGTGTKITVTNQERQIQEAKEANQASTVLVAAR